ncbi:MAG TPA: hypothetical protein VGH28_01360 [Polyangiaceae bacterium]|jgi:hypothetical protein
MVEAGILAPVFAMMMMMTVYLGGVYESKYRTVMLARYATFSYAANSCSNTEFKPDLSDLGSGIQAGQQQAGAGPSQSQSPAPPAQSVPGAKGGNNSGPGNTAAQATTGIFSSNGQATLTWNYSPTYKFNNGGPITIKSQGETLCNTPPNQGMNIFSYISNLVSMF